MALSEANSGCQHFEGVNKIALYIFISIKFSWIPLFSVSLATPTFFFFFFWTWLWAWNFSKTLIIDSRWKFFPTGISINCIPSSSYFPEMYWHLWSLVNPPHPFSVMDLILFFFFLWKYGGRVCHLEPYVVFKSYTLGWKYWRCCRTF